MAPPVLRASEASAGDVAHPLATTANAPQSTVRTDLKPDCIILPESLPRQPPRREHPPRRDAGTSTPQAAGKRKEIQTNRGDLIRRTQLEVDWQAFGGNVRDHLRSRSEARRKPDTTSQNACSSSYGRTTCSHRRASMSPQIVQRRSRRSSSNVPSGPLNRATPS